MWAASVSELDDVDLETTEATVSFLQV